MLRKGRLSPARLVLWAGLLMLSCATRRVPGPDEPKGNFFGVYRGRLEQGTPSREVSFRLLLWAEMPDRLHVELLPPVGGPKLLIDAGLGRLSVAEPAQRRAWVGPCDDATMNRVFGVRVDPGRLVRALLTGEEPGGEITLRREAGRTPGLPDLFEIASGSRRLRIERRALRELSPDSAFLGTGSPPSGFEILPIEELPLGAGASLLERQGVPN